MCVSVSAVMSSKAMVHDTFECRLWAAWGILYVHFRLGCQWTTILHERTDLKCRISKVVVCITRSSVYHHSAPSP
jgi:hypothetical protein